MDPLEELQSRTRWQLAGEAAAGFGRRFADLIESGEDIDGEARLADAMAPRNARILDVGSGMGRVAAALVARGHRVVAVEPDPDLVAQSRATYPDVEVVHADILGVELDHLGGDFDLVVVVGNVMVFLGEDTERAVLARIASLLTDGGRVLVGFQPTGGPGTARDYPPAEFVADVEASGLGVDLRLGTYELHPPSDDYTVWVLSRSATTDR